MAERGVAGEWGVRPTAPILPPQVGMGGRGSGEGGASLSPFRTGVANLQGASD